MDLRLLWSSFYFEVLQATTMLFYLLSGIETNRPRDSVPIPGSGRFLSLPGLPGLCISPAISGRSDNDLYGRSGAAARIAFKGWLLEVWDIWEYNYRMTLRKTHDNATPNWAPWEICGTSATIFFTTMPWRPRRKRADARCCTGLSPETR